MLKSRSIASEGAAAEWALVGCSDHASNGCNTVVVSGMLYELSFCAKGNGWVAFVAYELGVDAGVGI